LLFPGRAKNWSAFVDFEITERQGQVWAQESFDHIVRSEAEWEEKMEYVRQNPVKRGLVSSPEQYNWLYIRSK
jgi:hypothetical protein